MKGTPKEVAAPEFGGRGQPKQMAAPKQNERPRPKYALCANDQFYFLGYTGETVIALGQSEDFWRQYFNEVQPVRIFRHPLAWAYLKGKLVFICRDLSK